MLSASAQRFEDWLSQSVPLKSNRGTQKGADAAASVVKAIEGKLAALLANFR